MILSGAVEVSRAGAAIARVGAGSMITSGDGEPAAADCTVAGPTWLRRWDRAELDELRRSHPAAYLALERLVEHATVARPSR